MKPTITSKGGVTEKDAIQYEHPAFGQLQITRTSGSHMGALYGSSIRNHNTIRLVIHQSKKERANNRDWYFTKNELIEVEMSASQFAEAITSLNNGMGTPCTIRHIGMKRTPDIDYENQREKIVSDFQSTVQEAMTTLKQLQKEATAILSKPGAINKAEKELLLGKIESISREVTANMPFVHQSFNEAMDKTATEAKLEVEAFVNHKLVSLGQDALKAHQNLLEDK